MIKKRQSRDKLTLLRILYLKKMPIGFHSGPLVLLDKNLLRASTSIQKIELLRKQIILLLNSGTADELRSELFVYCVYWKVENVYLFKHLFCAEHSGHLYIIIGAKFLPDPSRQGLSSLPR